MGMRHPLAVALGAVFLMTSPAGGVPVSPPPSSPSPGPTLAPIDDTVTPDPAISAAPGAAKVLAHIYTSAFCSNFVEHFNAATRVVIQNDRHLDSVDSNLRQIEGDYNLRDGAIRVYDDRVKLIAIVGAMLKTIPVSQSAVNALLAQAKTTTDPERKAALLESASSLQKTIDRQRAVAYDLTGIIHVLLDKHTREDMAETNIQNTLPPGAQVNVDALDQPIPEPGENSITQPKPTATPSPGSDPSPGSLEDVLQWTRQRWIIGNAESVAAFAANRVVRICNSDHKPTPPPALPTAAPTERPH